MVYMRIQENKDFMTPFTMELSVKLAGHGSFLLRQLPGLHAVNWTKRQYIFSKGKSVGVSSILVLINTCSNVSRKAVVNLCWSIARSM